MKFCSLYSGSSGNCLYVEDDGTKILIDAGLSGKKIEEALKKIGVEPGEISALFLTHDHVDHVRGAGVLSRRYDIPIFANEGTWEAVSKSIGKISCDNKIIFKTEEEIYFNSLCLYPFRISHDAREPVGYSITNGKQKVGILTDTGIISDDIMNHLQKCDLAIIESNHDEQMLKVGRYPYHLKRRILSDKGHLSNEMAANAVLDLVKRGLKRVLLAHLSEENNFPELAYETTSKLLEINKIDLKRDVLVEVASRYNPSTVFSL